MEKIKIIFTIGTSFDSSNKPISHQAFEMLQHKTFQTLATLYGGYTSTITNGGWIDDNKRLVNDASLQIQVLTETPNLETVTRQAKTLAFSLCALWDQNCIVLEIQETNFSFISQTIDTNADYN